MPEELPGTNSHCQGNTDNDGTPDHLDPDSDAGTSMPSYFTDANNDGIVDGSGFDANGLVTGGDDCETPVDSDNLERHF